MAMLKWKNIQLEFHAVIFDMDGVLVNSEPFYMEVEQRNFRKLGLNVSSEEHNTYQGTATDIMWEKVIRRHGLSQTVDELVELTDSIVTPYFKGLKTIEPMPGVIGLIKKFSELKIPMAVASSSTPEVIEIILNKTGMKKYFGVVVDSRMAGSSKPKPDIFLLTAKKLGIQPEKCVVIEDSTNGIQAAKAAGMFCIAFSGPGSEHQDQNNADWKVEDFKEIISCLELH